METSQNRTEPHAAGISPLTIGLGSAPHHSIGDFSRATHVTVKMLRHYHQIGLLEPASVDPDNGYRSYTADQIPTAQVIRRFRQLQMPLEQIRDVLEAPDPATRNALISSHLDALQASLAETQSVVASLRSLLDGAPQGQSISVTYRNVEATRAAAISETVEIEGLGVWLRGALGELRATMIAQNVLMAGPAGGIYESELFTNEHGQATVFIPCVDELRAVGRVEFTVIPAAELATVTHHGTIDGLDLAYGALAAHVARHELGVDGPIREYYTVADTYTPDSAAWQTEIGWPIFATGKDVRTYSPASGRTADKVTNVSPVPIARSQGPASLPIGPNGLTVIESRASGSRRLL